MTELPQGLGAALAFIVGASVGSFVNVVAYRVPRDISIVAAGFVLSPLPPSCPALVQCAGAWIHPVARQMPPCGGWIAPRYLITELALGLIAVHLYLGFTLPDALARFALCAALFAVSWVDLDWRIIPDVISLPGIAVGVAAAALQCPTSDGRTRFRDGARGRACSLRSAKPTAGCAARKGWAWVT